MLKHWIGVILRQWLIPFIFLPQVLSAQVDSLLAVWNDDSNHDTVRVDALAEATIKLLYKDPERRLQLLDELEAKLSLMNDEKRTSQLLNFRGQGFLVKGEYDSALYFFDLSFDILLKLNDISGQGQLENNIGLAYMYQSNYDAALERLNASLNKKRKVGNTGSIPSTIMNIGMIHHQRGAHEEALRSYLRAYNLEDSLGNEKGAYVSLYHAGAVYNDMGNYPKAKELMLKCLPVAEKHDHIQLKSFVVDILGAIAFGQEEFDEAERYFRESQELALQMGSKYSLALSSNNLGELYVKTKQYEKALESLTNAVLSAQEIGEKSIESMASSNLGTLYAILKRYDEAEQNFKRALVLDKEMEDFFSEASNLQSLGIFYLETGRPSEAIRSCTRSHQLSIIDVALPLQKSACECLYKAYKKAGNVAQSFKYLEELRSLEDTLKNEERAKELTRLQMSFEHEKEQAADSLRYAQEQALKDVELEKQQLNNSRQRIALASAGIGLVLIIALSFSIFKGKQRAERAERYKEQFLANMSHEIRTPMHAISGMTKILMRKNPQKSQEKYLRAISDSAGNLLVILNDILDLSKVDEGKLRIENIPIEPERILGNVSEILRTKAEEKGIKIELEVEPGFPKLIQGDPTRMNQIVLNLMGNAIKFTEHGVVKAKLSTVGENFQLAVEDTGIGIPENKLEGVFGSFEQVDDSTTRKYGGTGLGLSITKRLVELQHGKIWVESEFGVGSTFMVELPLTVVESLDAPINELSEDELLVLGKDMAGLKVLLVEDDEFNRMVASDDLSYYVENVDLEMATNGELALEQFKKGSYDVVLMDIQMPVMGGLEATKRIRKFENSISVESKTPVLAMTASLLREEIDKCYEAGMDGYIPKPYKLEDLIRTIHQHIKA